MLSFLFLPIAIPNDDPQFNVYFDGRERYESHQNPTLFSPAGKNTDNLYSRYRLGVDYKSKGKLSARIEYQYASDVFWSQAQNASNYGSDLSLAYVDYSTDGFTGIGGRQKIELGQQRLIGSTEWLNLARSFDAGLVQDGQWDAWAGRLGVANNKPETARIDDITHTDPKWGTTSLIEKHDLGTLSTIDITALDHYAKAKLGIVKFDGEAAAEFGSSNGKDLRAWAWHFGADVPVLAKTTLRFEANAASGGGNSTTTRTFDNLYPSNHDLYGLADMVGWKNMNDFAVKLIHKPLKDLTIQGEAHSFTLRDPSDAWYNAVGAVNQGPNGALKDSTGSSGINIGQEYDLLATYAWKHVGTFSAGVAFFEPGDFVLNQSGFNASQMVFGFLQYQTRF